MLVLSSAVPSLLGDVAADGDGDADIKPVANVAYLTAVFFAMNFLAATQDIAVDGWALTMLSRSVSLSSVVFFSLQSQLTCSLLQSTVSTDLLNPKAGHSGSEQPPISTQLEILIECSNLTNHE